MAEASMAKKRKTTTVKNKPTRASYDYMVLFVVILLVLFGIVMIFSSSYYRAMTTEDFSNDMLYFVKKQFRNGLLGFVGMFIMSNFPYRHLRRFTLPAYIIGCILLILLIPFGTTANGQKRWLWGFQPSEIVKITTTLFLAHFLCIHKDYLKDFTGFIKCLAVVAIPCAMIAVTNFSTALLLALIGGTILFAAGFDIKYFAYVSGPVVGVGAIAILLPGLRYRLTRIQIWLDPFSDPTDKGYQIIQGLYALASGGLFGLGLGQSRQKTFLPEAYNDIIFAIIAEELGMLGAALIILLFAILVWRGIKIAINAQDQFGSLVATGITAQIAFQSIINIAVTTNTIPNTGQPLPFVSYGGTSLAIAMSMVGILLNISKYQKGME
ncbi:MAG: cell division protein FtsW [Firmicutes bacterium]|jgi:cell division protein FtsW|nr:cell division protein FtsW [Bacillota bacterium]